MEPLFTFGIPVFNGMPYLPETLESVWRQTNPHFKVLVIDDGSTDDSLQYLRSIKDSRLNVISQPNRGLPATLNRLLGEARTPWLVRLDADDTACPERLALLTKAIQQYPDAGMVYTDAAHYGHARVISRARTTRGSPEQLRLITQSGYLLSLCHSTVALHISKTLSLGGYRLDLYVQDIDLWWRMALQHDIVFLPEVTVFYRLHKTSACASNMEQLSLSALYVQYLLLSQLWNLPPLEYDKVAPYLLETLDQKRLQYRREMWLAGAEMSSRKAYRALSHLARAFLKSPQHFLDRITFPLVPNGLFRIGQDPTQFRQRQHLLWATDRTLLGEAS